VTWWVRRSLAVFALGSILACSGLGLCWKQFVPRAHDCCERETAADARPCSSSVVKTTAVEVVMPAEALPFLATERFTALVPHRTAIAEPRAAQSPPLVLRI
jgi:hypothetical protein